MANGKPDIPLGGSIGVPGSLSVFGFTTIDMEDSDQTLTSDQAATLVIILTGTLTDDRTLNCPANEGQMLMVYNATDGGFNVNVMSPDQEVAAVIENLSIDLCVYTSVSSGYIALTAQSEGFFVIDELNNRLIADITGPPDGRQTEMFYADANDNIVAINLDNDSNAQLTLIDGADNRTVTLNNNGIVFFSPANNTIQIVMTNNPPTLDFLVGNDTYAQLTADTQGGATSGLRLLPGSNDNNHIVIEGNTGGSVELTAPGTDQNALLNSSGNLKIQVESEVDITSLTSQPVNINFNSTLRYKFAPVTSSTPTRTLGTPFQNTSGQNMQVSVSLDVLASASWVYNARMGAANPPPDIFSASDVAPSSQNVSIPVVFIVPPDMWYEVDATGATLSGWVETLF